MGRSVVFLLAAYFLLVSQLFGQEQDSNSRKVNQYFVVPMDIVLMATVSQPDCPLLIEDARALRNVDGRTPGFYAYQIRNRSTKGIKDYALAVWYSDGSGSSLKPVTLKRQLNPDEIMRVPSGNGDRELVPLSKEMRKRLGLDKLPRVVAVLMVEHVHFVDGTSYHAENLSLAIQEYFLRLNGVEAAEKTTRRP